MQKCNFLNFFITKPHLFLGAPISTQQKQTNFWFKVTHCSVTSRRRHLAFWSSLSSLCGKGAWSLYYSQAASVPTAGVPCSPDPSPSWSRSCRSPWGLGTIIVFRRRQGTGLWATWEDNSEGGLFLPPLLSYWCHSPTPPGSCQGSRWKT